MGLSGHGDIWILVTMWARLRPMGDICPLHGINGTQDAPEDLGEGEGRGDHFALGAMLTDGVYFG